MPIPCPSCLSHQTLLVGEIPSANLFAGRVLTAPLSGGFLYECKTCFLLFRFPRLAGSDSNFLYRQADKATWSARSEERRDWTLAATWLTSAAEGGMILDVGCFDGGFLDSLGSRYERHGVEINEQASQEAQRKGVDIIGTDFSDLEKLFGSYDGVTALDVIEHVPDPFRFLALLAQVTRPGGTVIISTGNTDAPSWRLMGSRYLYCTIAEHISFINARWCHQAALRLGLQVCRIEKFSHGKATFPRRVSELVKNLFYLFFPQAAAWLRKKRLVGHVEASIDPSLQNHPPVWGSAKDHFMILFHKGS
jgi:2-polyprenyl-3-methyl-5-hydroxy-6-metoxy-1,4-benzoquinol methylase